MTAPDPDPTAAIRERLAAATDDIGLQYSVPADEWLLSCDKPTMQLLRHAPDDIAWLLGEVDRLRAAVDAVRALADESDRRGRENPGRDASGNWWPWPILPDDIRAALATHLPDDTKEA